MKQDLSSLFQFWDLLQEAGLCKFFGRYFYLILKLLFIANRAQALVMNQIELEAARQAFCSAYRNWIISLRLFNETFDHGINQLMKTPFEKRLFIAKQYQAAWNRWTIARDHWVDD